MNLLSIEKYGKAIFANFHSQAGDNFGELRTLSVAELLVTAERMNRFCESNGFDARQTPVFIRKDGVMHTISSTTDCFSSREIGYSVCVFETSQYNELHFVAPDSRPNNGEYWRSRGVGGGECSGFVVSKAAGERLRRMVNLVLENDTPKSHLDYRESEPDWIQFKFNENEFNLSNLDVMAHENGNVITLDMLYGCKIHNDVKDIL